MAEDFSASSSEQHTHHTQHIYQPQPRRNFLTRAGSVESPAHAFAPTTPPSLAESHSRPSDFLAQLNARLLRTYNARHGVPHEHAAAEGGQQAPPRNRSFMNLTKSTLFGIYDDESGAAGDRSVANSPWGTGAETPAPRSFDACAWGNGLGSPNAGLTMTARARAGGAHHHSVPSPNTRQASKARRTGLSRYAVVAGKFVALFLFGVVYGVVVSHLHDSRELAAVKVEGVDRGSWLYLASWGLAGIALGSSLPYVELLWGGKSLRTTRDKQSTSDKDGETSLGEQLNDIVRSVGAFMGIAFAIRRLPWQSTLQLTFTLALVNPALWYILDRSKPGLSLSLIVTSVLTSFIFLSNPDVLPSPSLPATVNGTYAAPQMSPPVPPQPDLFVGLVSYDNLAVVTWVGSVLFCSCVCFGSIGRRLAVWD